MDNDYQDDVGVCIHREAHNNQKIQYICLESSCLLNRLLCRKCVNQSHRKHKVGIIDKLIEPLNRLNMNSYYDHSIDDYNYLSDRLRGICDEWQKLNQSFYNNMKELENGILFQLTTVMKTFTNDEIDKAYEVLTNGDSDIEVVNEYVNMINFLNKDYLQDVEAVKKFADVIAERVKRSINKTAKKVDILFKKMQDHIKQLDFSKYREFKEHPEEIHETSQNKSLEKASDRQEEAKPKKEDEQSTQLRPKVDFSRNKEIDPEEITNRFGFAPSYAQRKVGFNRFKK